MKAPSATFLRASCTLLALAVAAVPALADAQAPATGREATQKDPLHKQAMAAMRKAATFYRTKAASHGGYVYYYSEDLKQRWGEGKADAEQIWVQPPGTPSVGMAFLEAFAATKDPFYLDAAREAALALVQGQLESGGWTNSIHFGATGKDASRYRKMPGGTRNYSSFDDGITQNALRLLMRVDQALNFQNAEIHEASEYARNALLKAQFASGGFPQGWTKPVPERPSHKARYPDYDWRTENRIKEYWDLPTLNDNLVGYLIETLEEAWLIYRDERCRKALTGLGDFLILAQMPDPQPAWAQQYDHEMRPAWARKFEPPAIAGRESIGAIKALLQIHRITGDKKYLEPIPRALAYLQKSLLPGDQLARYCELKTNRPLYMTKDYALTYDDADVPAHYAWKSSAKLDRLVRRYEGQVAGRFPDPEKLRTVTDEQVRTILSTLDAEGRWVSVYSKNGLVGQPKFAEGMRYISSAVFNENLEVLSHYLRSAP
jgi:PelA/Pel-15E family pectate lyase